MKDTIEFNQMQHQAWILWHEVQDLIAKCEEVTFTSQVGIPYQQFVILLIMASIDGPVSETVLAQKARRNINSISTIVERMQKQGFVKRTRNRKDRRITHLTMTDLGKEMLISGMRSGWNMVKGLTGIFSESDLQEGMRMLAALKENTCRVLNLDPSSYGLQNVDYSKLTSMLALAQMSLDKSSEKSVENRKVEDSRLEAEPALT